ncbi:hypothetical protein CDL15_Pgr027634 [Punica granatum]|uniref:Protein kinase domain-containing protein n=1 Tax=Punica granatum TaxID=22663 RepID=A0A218XIT1_PUNGR|nr:hypothetical protein CDL15_Pgr027634 [Punica granatum]
MQSEVTELPESPRCPILKALYLHRNCKLRTIPISFFEYMPALQVLNFSRTRIKTLPDSLFSDSNSEGDKGKSNALIPEGTISALSQLEELSIDVDPENERWERAVGASVNDIRGLKMLNTAKLYFPYVEHLMNFNWYSTPIERFEFTVGRHAKRIMSRFPQDLQYELEQWDRCLKYMNDLEEISLCDCPRLSVLIEEVGNKHLTKIKGQASLAFSSTSCCGAKQSRTSEGKSVEGETRQSWNLEGKSVEGEAEKSRGSEGKLVEVEARQSRKGKLVKSIPRKEVLPNPKLWVFSFAEFSDVTKNFNKLARRPGSSFKVYRGYLDVKAAASPAMSEVTYIGGLSHPNIVDLLGYRSEGRERILVYKFKENLEQYLRQSFPRLSWDLRLKIAVGAARGLAFLHQLEIPVIYRVFKASKILLDGNAKLSGFRMANLAVDESHLTTGVSETYDHAAPEYVATGNFLTVSCTSAPKLRPHCFRQYAFNNSCSAFNRAAN